jgi:thiol-disulfide isomerase/thioredoxin
MCTRISAISIAIVLLAACSAVAASYAVPNLQLPSLTGEIQTLSDQKEKIVVLNFWATWCIPCRKEMPVFVKLHREYENHGVLFIAASRDEAETRNEVAKFAKEFAIPFPIWLNATAEQQASFRLATALPATVIIDRQGKAVFRIIGESTERDLRARLNYLLSGSPNQKAPNELVLPPGITAEHFREHELGLEDEHEEEPAEDGSAVPS